MWSSSSFISSTGAALSSNESPLHSIAQYIEDYIDLVENVPNDIARQITQLHEHDHRYHQLLSQLEATLDVACGKTSASDLKRRNAMLKIQRYLIEIQEIADEKLVLIQSILDQLDSKARQLDYDYRAVNMSSGSTNAFNSRGLTHSLSSGSGNSNMSLQTQKSETNNVNSVNITTNNNSNVNNTNSNDGTTKEIKDTTTTTNTTTNTSGQASSHHHVGGGKRASRRQNSTRGNHHDNNDTNVGGKRSMKRGVKGRELKKSKSSGLLSNSPPVPLYEGAPIDPDEPTYCLCDQVSFGEMICCDNSACNIEWFHFSCVSLTTKPKGKWYCPNCRGERSNIPKK